MGEHGPPDPEEGVDPHLLDNVSTDAKNFTLSLLELDPIKRLSAAGGLAHPWLARRSEEIRTSYESQTPLILKDLQAFLVFPRARRICLLMVAWSLTNEERASVRDHFIAIDARHEGTIV